MEEEGEGTPVEEKGKGTPVEEKGEKTSVEEEGEETLLKFLISSLFSFPVRMVLEIAFDFLISNILFVLPFNFFLLIVV